ncbi:hypothetical protein EAH69_03480 [Faecalibacter macacae]|uniref:Bacterial surface antigen (D15) domain-containing protein n=1 Tax=Faecalibacter macacae TaxID=1859289 RepID=A0A3L9MLJ0_9FLAO|nr:hypothetical protein EAH69_03480 [Faecalibacter macacae]
MFYIYSILLFLCGISVSAQNKTEFYRWNEQKNSYEFDFYTDNQIKALDSLASNGFYTLQIDSINADKVYLNKGKNYKKIWVKNESIFKNKDFNPTNNLDSIITKYIEEKDKKGYAFTNVQLIPQGNINDEQKIELKLNLGELRKIDAVKSVGYTKLSKGYIKHGLGLKKGKIYNESILANASNVMQNTNYLQQLQEPQTLFRPDSTIVYLYPKKVKSNTFDGILGFGNDDNGDFKLNGNVQLELNNIFNGLEQIRLNWIGTANKNTTLDIRVKLPYLFKSPIGSETQFKLFKQDSVFVNLDLNERLFYQINPNSSLGANLSYTSSNYLLDDESFASNYDDFNKTGIGLSYEYFVRHPFQLMEGKSLLRVFASSITRKEKNFSWFEDIVNESSQQYEIGLETFRIFQLHQKHYIKGAVNFKGLFDENDSFSENELYRIGGFGSIRGFNEESIIANLYGIGSVEYRFLPNDGFYISLFGDYAFIDNKRMDLNTNFISFGTGLSFMTKIGIFNLSYAVGKTENTPFDFKESKIHFGILSQF